MKPIPQNGPEGEGTIENTVHISDSFGNAGYAAPTSYLMDMASKEWGHYWSLD
jgi:hypothetical protein